MIRLRLPRCLLDGWSSPWTAATVVLISSALALGGCERPAQESTPTRARSAEEVLQGMLAVYEQANSYSDRGAVRLSFREGGRWREDEGKLSVSFIKPNKLAVQAYQLTLACDGETLFAKVTDPISRDVDGQVVVRDAPTRIMLDELYQDAILQSAMVSGLGRHAAQLELLFAEKPLEAFLGPGAKRRLLDDQAIEGTKCQRVEVTTDEGPFVLWIDAATSVLRRLEYPAAQILPELSGQADVSELSLVADFNAAEVNQPVDEKRFEFEVPANAKRVTAFVRPPLPLPSRLFGQRPPNFSLAGLDGRTVSGKSLKDRIAVLMWFNDHQACKFNLQQLEKVYASLDGNVQDRPAFYAVFAGESSTSDEMLSDLMHQWSVTIPVLRDSEAVGRDVFQIAIAPALVVLDRSGTVQLFELEANPELARHLPVVLQRLEAGENLAAEILAQEQREQENYVAALSGTGSAGTTIAIPQATLHEKSEPQRLKLAPLWTCDELRSPGNLLVLEQPDREARILALDGPRTVVELDGAGRIVERHELPIPDGASVTYLRAAQDGSGRWHFVGSALLSPQLFVFDDQWQRLASYPPQDQSHPGIHDVQLADLDGNGQLELCVGFWGEVGIHGASLEGEHRWANRSATNVLSVATTPRDDVVGWRKLLVSSDRGTILRLNQFGLSDPDVTVKGQLVHHLYAARFTGGRTSYCGLSFTEKQELLALGLDEELREVWKVQAAQGVFHSQIQFVTSGRLLADAAGQWIIAGPDGTIRVVGDDGKFFDYFGYGQFLTGIAATELAGHPTLLVATEESVAAWSVTAPTE